MTNYSTEAFSKPARRWPQPLLGSPLENRPALLPGRQAPEFLTRQRFLARALHVLGQTQEAGLLHTTEKTASGASCLGKPGDSFYRLLPTITESKAPKAVQPARWQAQVDEKACNQCGLCRDTCPEGAIILDSGPAIVEATLCLGCGQCVGQCPAQALTLRQREQSLPLGSLGYLPAALNWLTREQAAPSQV